MSTAKLLECAKAEGILLRLDGERLKWIADHQPPAMLLAEIKAHRLEIIARLTVVNASTEARDWLTRVACFLDCSPEHLLVNDWIDRHDLAEQHQHQPWLVAKQIGSDPRWRTPSEHSERACEGVSTAETDEFRAQYARARRALQSPTSQQPGSRPETPTIIMPLAAARTVIREVIATAA